MQLLFFIALISVGACLLQSRALFFFFFEETEGHWPLLKFIKQKQKAITITDKKR
jgi:hypothetical protein